MKRSQINQAIMHTKGLLEKNNIKLPPFGYWSLEEWKSDKRNVTTIKEVMLGWDITDYGNGIFDEFGAVLFTLRNGSLTDSRVGTPYAEKLIVLKDGQRLPTHYHASKTEDIINRAGEVASINDDNTDNYNAEDVSRFSKIEEDEPILHPLCNEYIKVLGEQNV